MKKHFDSKNLKELQDCLNALCSLPDLMEADQALLNSAGYLLDKLYNQKEMDLHEPECRCSLCR